MGNQADGDGSGGRRDVALCRDEEVREQGRGGVYCCQGPFTHALNL